MRDDLSPGLAPEQKVVRRLRLPADRRTPAAARAVVRSVLAEAKLEGLLDAALLLTTELSTNAVIHAGTDLELEAVADADGLTVTVTDQVRGMIGASAGNGPPPNVRLSLADLSERGRGLLLVDHFATQWGTNHFASGKGVWFRLDRDDQHISDGVPTMPRRSRRRPATPRRPGGRARARRAARHPSRPVRRRPGRRVRKRAPPPALRPGGRRRWIGPYASRRRRARRACSPGTGGPRAPTPPPWTCR